MNKSLDPLRAKKNIHMKERRWARLYSFGSLSFILDNERQWKYTSI